jgi:hypothetical protein
MVNRDLKNSHQLGRIFRWIEKTLLIQNFTPGQLF